MIHTANSQQIRDGLVTDVYFERTREILEAKGKRSGSKRVMRCEDCMETVVVPRGKTLNSCSCGGKMQKILTPLLSQCEPKTPLPAPREIRDHVIGRLVKVEDL